MPSQPGPEPTRGTARRSGNPAVRAQAERGGGSAEASRAARRESLETRSRPWLLRLSAVPRALLLISVAVFMALGLFLPGVFGAVFLLALVGFLGWLLALSWPVITPVQRLLRVVVAALVGGFALAKLLGRA